MTTRLLTPIALCLVFVLASCSSTPVRTSYDFDKSVNFTQYKTFAWVGQSRLYLSDELKSRISPLLAERLSPMVENQLIAKGLQKVENLNDADLIVGMTLGARDRIRVDSYPTSSLDSFGRYYRPYYRTSYWAYETRTTEYTEAVLAIDLFDTKTERPVWHGRGTRNFTHSSRPVTDEQLNAAVTEILSKYPPE